jgi:arylsulfatase A-like enzyme
MAHTDYEVGRVLDRVKSLGKENDTMVILMIGDNGASAEGRCRRIITHRLLRLSDVIMMIITLMYTINIHHHQQQQQQQ